MPRRECGATSANFSRTTRPGRSASIGAVGDDPADKLGTPVSSAAPFLVMIALANTEARRWQTFTPQSSAQALRKSIAGRMTADRSAGILGGTTYQQHAQTAPTAAHPRETDLFS